mmetsp:Transcript_123393/g.356695  ORF Transcript_123393/g.356695 Transcript_123393/m.356695 type:complete len:270 (-) Transcript_123393:246-1055(-)
MSGASAPCSCESPSCALTSSCSPVALGPAEVPRLPRELHVARRPAAAPTCPSSPGSSRRPRAPRPCCERRRRSVKLWPKTASFRRRSSSASTRAPPTAAIGSSTRALRRETSTLARLRTLPRRRGLTRSPPSLIRRCCRLPWRIRGSWSPGWRRSRAAWRSSRAAWRRRALRPSATTVADPRLGPRRRAPQCRRRSPRARRRRLWWRRPPTRRPRCPRPCRKSPLMPPKQPCLLQVCRWETPLRDRTSCRSGCSSTAVKCSSSTGCGPS